MKMKEILIKGIIILAIIFVILILTSCNPTNVDAINNDRMFIKIENCGDFYVVYNAKTKVMYAVSNGASNTGTLTLLVNPDGYPMVYNE